MCVFWCAGRSPLVLCECLAWLGVNIGQIGLTIWKILKHGVIVYKYYKDLREYNLN
jgi:hypothetical protein